MIVKECSCLPMSKPRPSYHELQQENKQLCHALAEALERLAQLEGRLASQSVTKDSGNSN